ncbi:hypothetical protein FSP39_015212 [Pinctada imbricata]|uniref:non-specific serine/threonine protein kinase n=1 Tax=Pinctada imbricata TaxID=66713 RepID=A0AA88XKE6_PINIB|nr:hypothetical protein FSP39_015212 [Pinctada imbricata]
MNGTSESIYSRDGVLNDLVKGQVTSDDLYTSLLTKDGLLDALLVLYRECCQENLMKNKHVSTFVRKYGSTIDKVQKLRIKVADFEVKDVIGRGHFGEVQVVREKVTGTVFAMKILHKHETLAQHEISFYEEERDIMAKAASPWITKLHYAFQDAQNLYLIMEFHAGGDLLSLLSRHDDIFEESMARFYVAEMTLAINALHSMGYVHRDIKPENVLIDIKGHVKLADFGSSAKLSPDMLVASRMPVGTPDYVSPELLTSMDKDHVHQNYGVEVDWWSLGICMYEMLYGKTPFTDDNGSMCITYANIMNFKNCLTFPSDINVSSSAISLIKSLLADKKTRYGYLQISKHHFFKTLDLENIRSEKPPFIPHLASLDDTSNFEEFERIKYQPNFDEYNTSKDFSGKDLPFVGFTYTKSRNTAERAPRLSLLREDIKESTINDTSSSDDSGPVNVDSGSRNLEVKLTVKINELQNKYHELEESECSIRSEMERVQHDNKDKEDKITGLALEKEAIEKELQIYVTKCVALTSQLDTVTAERDHLEIKASKLYSEISEMTREAEAIEEEILRCQVEELQDYVKELETERQSLRNMVGQKDKQLNEVRELYGDTKKQLTQLKKRLDKEKRKSRDDHKRDFAMLESMEESWKKQIHDKCTESAEKEHRIQELQDLLEAYEEQEKEFMEREQKLLKKLEQGKSSDKLDIRVLLQTGPSPRKKRESHYEQKKNRIQELEDLVEKYEADSKAWQEEEDNYQEIIDGLRNEVEAYKHQQKMSIHTKENLKQQVEMYQSEVTALRQKIKELQENVRLCLEEKDNEKQQAYLEKHKKELEVEIELLREDKRNAFKEKLEQNHEIDELKHRISENERVDSNVIQTINRLTSRLERTERQLSQSRDREIEVRLKARESQEIRNKLQEAQIEELRKENNDLENQLKRLKVELETLKTDQSGSEVQKVEIKRLQETIEKNLRQQNQLQEKVDKAINEKFDLNKKLRKLESENDTLHTSLKCCKDEIEKMDESLKGYLELKEEQTRLRDENDQLSTKISDLETELQKLEQMEKLKEEKNRLEIKLQSVEKELDEQKILSAKRWNKLDDAEDLRQENKFLESKVKTQQSSIEQLELKIKSSEEQQKTLEQKDKKIASLSSELDQLRLRRRSAEVRVQELQREMDQKQQQSNTGRRDVQHLENQLQTEREKNDSYLEDLRKELKEYNVALSEAKSLLTAQQRIEQSMREKHEAEIRELKMKLYRAQGVLEGEDDVKLLKAQNDALNRQIQNMDDRITHILKEKGEISMERQTLKDKVLQLEHSCDLEKQKVEILQNSCGELERQIQDLEALMEENDKKEKEWENIRKTYETAVDERENEIEGTSQRVHALEQARQASNERYDKLKQQLQAEKSKHKTDVETLNEKLWEAKKIANQAASQLLEMENQVARYKTMNETQARSLEVDTDEKTKLKEEISCIITENQALRAKNLKLKQGLDEAMDKFELIFGEKVDLENFAEALQGLHFLERYKFESTIGQQMKLIDYLKVLYEENNDKKKKVSNLGKKGSKSQLPGPALPGLTDLQNALELERKRNVKLTEQLDKLRQENLCQAQELLNLKGPLKERMDGSLSSNVKAEVAALTRTAPDHALLTPRVNKSQRFMMQDLNPGPQRMCHAIPHKLKMGLNTRATKCGVCLGSIPFVRHASKCQMCHMTYHPKCLPEVTDNCGMPTEYVHYFSEIMTKVIQQPQRYSLLDGNSPLRLDGWLKVQRAGKPRWEKRWGVLENNLLLLYRDEGDANPVDTFELNPSETDVGIHSAISVAELSSTAQSDLPYVIKIEHVPLTTCWSGRVLYLMALNFNDKQKWAAYLEAAVKSLQRVDTSFKRMKLEQHKLLELSGDRRLELNCTLVLSKQILLLGADEGLYGVNIHNGRHAVITKLAGIHQIHYMVYTENLSSIIVITGKDRHVIYIHKDAIKTRLNQATSDETTKVPYTVIETLPGCTVLEVTENNDGLYVIGGLADRIVVLKYNTDLREFCVRKEFMTTEPCSCLCVTEEFALVGTDKFYKITLDHHTMAEFVDKKDNSLGFAAYGAAKRMSFPLAVANVTPEGCPQEFILCFHEFGVFVDSKGRRSRGEDMKWSCLPLSFGYSEPFLYVTYFNSVQAITIPANKNETRGKQTCLDIHFPRYLGNAMTSGGVYIADNRSYGTDLVCLRGNDGLPGGELPGARVENKENQPKYV